MNRMTNADKFKNIFGLYATELWSMPEKDFLKWLNSEAMSCSGMPNSSEERTQKCTGTRACDLIQPDHIAEVSKKVECPTFEDSSQYAQPDNRLSKIAELAEGTIDHFDLDDAMDLLYQIKEIVGNEASNIRG